MTARKIIAAFRKHSGTFLIGLDASQCHGLSRKKGFKHKSSSGKIKENVAKVCHWINEEELKI